MVNCEKHPELAEKANVDSYPTFVLNNGNKYTGERTLKGFVNFLKSNI